MTPKPPRFITSLLESILLPEIQEDIMGDLTEEFYQQLGQRTVARSRWWYAVQAIRLCRPSLVRKPAWFHRNNNFMLTSHLHTAWRQIQHHRQSALVNLLGYTLALVAIALLWLYVAHETSYDKQHPHADETYRISTQQFNPSGELTRHFEASAPRLGPTLAEEFGEVAGMVRIYPWNFPTLAVGDQVLNGQQTAAVDATFFDFFETEFIQGDPEKALENPHSLVVTTSKAEALFGPDWEQQSIVGTLVDFSDLDTTLSFTVTAVIEDMPRQQHLQFNYLAPLSYLEALQPPRFQQEIMGDYNFFTYLHLPNGYAGIEAGMKEFIDEHQSPGETAAASELYKLYFQKLTDIHLDAGHNGVLGVAGDLQQIQIFMAIGLLIGIVACVNYINLATARFRRRWREMAVRKVNGAHRRQLLGQFMVETFLMLSSATILAAGIVALTIETWETFVDRDLTTGLTQMGSVWVGFTLLLGSMWLLSGVYPALYLSRVQIGSLLRSRREAPAGKYDYRSVLVGFQYVVAIGLLISLGVINRQFSYIDEFETGFRRDHIVHFRLPGALRSRSETFRQEVTKHPDIESVTYNSRVPAGSLGDALDGGLPDVEGMTTIPFRLPFITIDEAFT
ncbi:MAG: permease prefix domain 2-containing transporter [Bacteroidota bacterium]